MADATALPQLPDALWHVLDVLANANGRGALTYEEIGDAGELNKDTVSRHVITLVDHTWATTQPRCGRLLEVSITPVGRQALIERKRLPTVDAVIAYARKLQRDAAAAISADAFARPYNPTDDTARRLSAQHGPERALEILRERAARAGLRQREEDELATRAAKRHARRRREARRDRDAARAQLTPGQRMDAALAALSVIQAAPAAMSFDSEPVKGGKDDNPIPRFHGDPAAKARKIAIDAVRAVEAALDEAREREATEAA